MIVGIDPETGRLGPPTKAARTALAIPALDRSMEGLAVAYNPDGSKMIDLQGKFQEYTVVHITPDGRKVETCVQRPEVDAALNPTPASTTPPAAARTDAASPTAGRAER
jgi:hypothetical protein